MSKATFEVLHAAVDSILGFLDTGEVRFQTNIRFTLGAFDVDVSVALHLPQGFLRFITAPRAWHIYGGVSVNLVIHPIVPYLLQGITGLYTNRKVVQGMVASNS